MSRMDGEVPENGKEKSGSVSNDLSPRRSAKTLRAMKAPYSVKRITFNPSEANPGERLEVRVPKLNENEVKVPGSLALRFDIDLSGGYANNYLVQNVSPALVSQQVVKFEGTALDDIMDYDMYKIFTDLFLPEETRGNMLSEGIQSKKLSQIRSGAGDKPTSGVDAENKLEKVYGKKYRISLDHQILTDHGVFYPQALYNELVFELVLAPADQVVKGSDSTKLRYKLTNIQLEYEMIRSQDLAKEATSVYESGKEFLYDHVSRSNVVSVDTSTELINIKINSQRRSMKGILLLFVKRYTAGTRDSEEYIFPDLKKVLVTINGSPNMLCNSGIESEDAWRQASRFFMKQEHKPQHMTLKKFHAEDKFGLLIDLRSMASQKMHGSGTRLVNTTDGVQLEINSTTGKGNFSCHVFIISDAQFNIQNRQLDSVIY